MKLIKFYLLLLCLVGSVLNSEACSRVVYIGDDDIVMVGRTLDWRTPIPTNIYYYPRGLEKKSMPSGNCLQWTSRYATVLAVGYDAGVTEGMNECGLVMNGLFCKGTIYKTGATDVQTPTISLAVIVSYFLDNFATVDEVETWLKNNEFCINGKTFDGGTVSTLHWALTDASGCTLIIEYENGELHTYKDRALQVLTNDPPYTQMQAINTYWHAVGGKNMLPGTVRSADRFVRASFFIENIPTNLGQEQAFGSLVGIMGTVSVPLGYSIEGEPNISSTQWTSVSDAGGRRYYFRQSSSAGFLNVDMAQFIHNNEGHILKLDMSKSGNLMGCANKFMEISNGFSPLW